MLGVLFKHRIAIDILVGLVLLPIKNRALYTRNLEAIDVSQRKHSSKILNINI